MFLQVIDTSVKGAFNEGLRTTTVGDLKMKDKIKNTAPDSQKKRYAELFDMFEKENLTNFIRIVSDFQNVVGGLIQEWENTGKLSDLKSPFHAVEEK